MYLIRAAASICGSSVRAIALAFSTALAVPANFTPNAAGTTVIGFPEVLPSDEPANSRPIGFGRPLDPTLTISDPESPDRPNVTCAITRN